MGTTEQEHVAAGRRRDLLLTAVALGVLLTPAWLLPARLALPWELLCVVFGVPSLILSWRHAPWVPTPAAELPRLLRALALSPGERFCDLGAGDGRVLLWVRAATGATVVGIEASPLMALVARLRIALRGDAGTTLWWRDLYGADLSTFDVLYVWGTPYSVGTERFLELLRRSARPGARLVSYHVPVPALEPCSIDRDGLRPLYTYVL